VADGVLEVAAAHADIGEEAVIQREQGVRVPAKPDFFPIRAIPRLIDFSSAARQDRTAPAFDADGVARSMVEMLMSVLSAE
jgi:hypothetical protein